VSRAICDLDADGTSVLGLVEHHAIAVGAHGARSEIGPLALDGPVSTNFWGFHPSLAAHLTRAVTAFQDSVGDVPDAELALPTAIDAELRAGRLSVDALAVGTDWVGITHAADLPAARTAMARLAPVPMR
jgi:hypothetical protein